MASALAQSDLELPRLLSRLTPATGLIKQEYEDFVVDEEPAYEFSGQGTHTYFLLEKRGLSTMQAVADVARALNVRRFDIGFAGMKDARAVTRQWMSIEHVDPQKLAELEVPRMKVLETTRHGNKLRIGHLRGNRFQIKVRNTAGERLAELQDGLRELTKRGVPNYFGVQRFGGRGDAWEVGRAVVRGELETALDFVLGKPGPRDRGTIREAREAYEKGDYERAARGWPGMFRDERRALKALQRPGAKKKRAFLAIDEGLRRFYVSAYQSHLFNQILARRMSDGPDRLLLGDLAWIHPHGAVFEVTDLAAEQPRAERFEISPTGPLFGYRMSKPTGAAGEMEAELLAGENLAADAFRNPHLRLKGARRPMRFPVEDASMRLAADARGPYLALDFALPRGCYATALLRELFATPAASQDEHSGESEDASD